MLKKAGQRKSGAVYVQGPQRDILVVLSLVEELQVEFLDDLAPDGRCFGSLSQGAPLSYILVLD